MKSIYVYPGNLAVSADPAKISTLLGSCVAVVLFDQKLKIGGLNHYLLPRPSPNDARSTRYGTIAIATLLEELYRFGSNKRDLLAKVYGGGNVLDDVKVGIRVGEENIKVALEILERERIRVVEKNVGGKQSRRIAFFTDTFEVEHTALAISKKKGQAA